MNWYFYNINPHTTKLILYVYWHKTKFCQKCTHKACHELVNFAVKRVRLWLMYNTTYKQWGARNCQDGHFGVFWWSTGSGLIKLVSIQILCIHILAPPYPFPCNHFYYFLKIPPPFLVTVNILIFCHKLV